tara:strand:- start:647 stop:877 length:231 start_codon:yes stop_codon:yes gene_type:complete
MAAAAPKISLKRLAPGYYMTRDGKWEVCKTVYPHDGSTWWHFRSTVSGHKYEEAGDHVTTKRQAVEWLAHAIAEEA